MNKIKTLYSDYYTKVYTDEDGNEVIIEKLTKKFGEDHYVDQDGNLWDLVMLNVPAPKDMSFILDKSHLNEVPAGDDMIGQDDGTGHAINKYDVKMVKPGSLKQQEYADKVSKIVGRKQRVFNPEELADAPRWRKPSGHNGKKFSKQTIERMARCGIDLTKPSDNSPPTVKEMKQHLPKLNKAIDDQLDKYEADPEAFKLEVDATTKLLPAGTNEAERKKSHIAAEESKAELRRERLLAA